MKVFAGKIYAGILCAVLLCSCVGRQAPKTDEADPGLKDGVTVAALPSAPLAAARDDLAAISLMPQKPLEEMISQLAAGTTSDIDLKIPAKFAITRPAAKLTTTYDKYFITGTSDPKQPVYFSGNEISRLGTKGTFGVLVNLEMGVNSFTFKQGDQTQTVSITRKAYVKPESVPITQITQSSMIPAVYAGAQAGEALDVGCIAPSGASVTATFAGKSVTLTQVAATSKAGVPAHFTGSITVGNDYEADVTKKAGKVAYKMTYNGSTKSYESTGNVYVAGENSRIAVRVTSYMGFVYPDFKDVSVFREKLKKGAADYLKTQDNTYVQLVSGGYIPKEQTEIIEGQVAIGNKLSRVSTSTTNKSESYTFSGTCAPAFLTGLGDGTFTFTLFNTNGSPAASPASGKLFSNIAVANDGASAVYTFTVSNPAKLWGYNVSYSGTDTILTFRYKPSLKPGDRPFEGITIVLDPGHGGSDPGALGVAGESGPAESDVNLAHAYVTRDLLASMGANVVLTRSEDVYYSLDDRLQFSEDLKADFFISLHHNSIAENADANKTSGMEMYYHTGLSKKLADIMMSVLSKNLNRENRTIEQSYYRVTLNSYAPAILAELGFISNPLEYERAANTTQMKKVAEAIAEGVKQSLS